MNQNNSVSVARPIEPGKGQVVAASRSEIYGSYAKRHFSSMYVFDRAEYQRMSRKYAFQYRRFLPTNRDAAILDVGCGVGHFLSMLEKEGYTNCVGLDVSADAIDICRSNVESRVYLSDAFEFLETHPNSADFIVNMHVLEHLDLKEGMAFVKLLANALRDQGTLVLATPNADSPWAGHCMFDDLTHRRLYTPRTLRQVLSECDFTSIDLYAETPAPYDALTFIRWVLAKGVHAIRKLTFAVEIGPGRCRRNEMIFTPGMIAVASKRSSGLLSERVRGSDGHRTR